MTVNDNFANKTLLSGLAPIGQGSNIGATGEVGEPVQHGITNSVWWSWTAPNDGIFTIDTKNSNFDTWLSVYTGSTVNNLSLIDRNDDVNFAAGDLTSLVTLNTTAGTTYQIAVDGYASSTGSIQLKIVPLVINGTPSDDTLTGTTYSETINGLAGWDRIMGGDGNDTISGGDGANYLDGGLGADRLIGGLITDTYIVDNVGDIIIELPNQGTNDEVLSTITYTLPAEVENISLRGTAGISATGNNLNNTIQGNSGNNILNGLDGNDYIMGNSGADQLTGGLGNDIYEVDNTGDVVTELAGEGTDEVRSTLTYTLPAQVENLRLEGNNLVNGTGNTLPNLIVGTQFTNTLNGGTGADTLVGGQGSDIYEVDDVGDVVIEYPVVGIDRVVSTVTYTLPADVEDLNLIGTAAINGTGNNLGNTIVGNSANNTLAGGGGFNVLTGNGGADTFLFKFVDSSLSVARDTISDFAIGTDKIDLLTQGGATMNAPVSFSRAADDTTSSSLIDLANKVFIDANGELAGNQALGINSAALVASISDNYLVINDGTAGFQQGNDLVIGLVTSNPLPPMGNIPVTNFFV
jgi:Ca2+-binding RTX toxin-like protein